MGQRRGKTQFPKTPLSSQVGPDLQTPRRRGGSIADRMGEFRNGDFTGVICAGFQRGTLGASGRCAFAGMRNCVHVNWRPSTFVEASVAHLLAKRRM